MNFDLIGTKCILCENNNPQFGPLGARLTKTDMLMARLCQCNTTGFK